MFSNNFTESAVSFVFLWYSAKRNVIFTTLSEIMFDKGIDTCFKNTMFDKQARFSDTK